MPDDSNQNPDPNVGSDQNATRTGSWHLLDRVLRGDATSMDELRAGSISVPARQLLLISLALGMVFGGCIGLYGWAHPGQLAPTNSSETSDQSPATEPSASEDAATLEAFAQSGRTAQADRSERPDRSERSERSDNRTTSASAEPAPTYLTAVERRGKWLQPISAGLKIPLLFGLTLLITLPSLYVFSALAGSRLSPASVIRLLSAMMAVMLAVSASLGPIIVFFSVSTQSYAFMKLMVVICTAIGGFLGLAFLLRTLHRLVMVQRQMEVVNAWCESRPSDAEANATSASNEGQRESQDEIRNDEPEDAAEKTKAAQLSQIAKRQELAQARKRVQEPAALDLIGNKTDRRAVVVFRVWVVVFSLVGAQMSWMLRPFLGNPESPFVWFRARQSHFFEAMVDIAASLLGLR